MRKIEERIIDELKNEGIDAESVEIVKNGIPCKGIRICYADGTVCPIVYYSEHETVDSFMERVRDVLAKDTTSFGVERLTDWSYVKEHAYLSVQKRGTEDFIKRPYLNLEIVLRIYLDLGDEAGSVKVTSGLIDQLGITEETAWEAACDNTRRHISVRNLADILGGEPSEDDMLYVATAGQHGGAAALCYKEVFREFCLNHGEADVYILPSSTEEVLVIPGSKVGIMLTVRDLAQMVDSINRSQVDPIIQLEPAVYRFSLMEDTISIAATADGEGSNAQCV